LGDLGLNLGVGVGVSDDQELLSGAALVAFRLNGQFLEIAEELARPVGLTAAWWQVLGAVLPAPLPVAGIAREMGISRQSVQRIADLLVAKGLAEYRPNPAHRRAKLVEPTAEGRAAVHRIHPAHARTARKLADEAGRDALRRTVDAMRQLSEALDALADADAG
jgi:DNA-binding MarR family transcriptional regulator